jgi:dTDP-4-amino-4,6-dideoxygalactose transaminase
MMGLDLKPGDEVITADFTFAATVEVIALLQLTPVLVEVDMNNMNISLDGIRKAITPKTKAIVPVHLFGRAANMDAIMEIAKEHNLYVIEDNAQAIGSDYKHEDGSVSKTGTIGDIGCTSFFPSKNLGCYGDGGAIYTNNDDLAVRLKGICHHGELGVKYYHDIVGCNSRLDTLQAVILNAKIKRLKDYEASRNIVADFYDNALKEINWIETPFRSKNSTHVFHQYTMKIKNGQREALKTYLQEKEIPSMIYYPMPLHFQKAYAMHYNSSYDLNVSEKLSKEVLSLPIHTEMNENQLNYIVETIKNF